MDRTRIKLAVYMDLDPTPGEMHSADSARNVVSEILRDNLGHYEPMVSIESYNTRADITGPAGELDALIKRKPEDVGDIEVQE